MSGSHLMCSKGQTQASCRSAPSAANTIYQMSQIGASLTGSRALQWQISSAAEGHSIQRCIQACGKVGVPRLDW